MRHHAPVLMMLSLASLAFAAGCSGTSGNPSAAEASTTSSETVPQEEAAIAVRVATADLGPLSSLYTTSATLRADKEATITARTHGVVQRLAVEEGDRVEQGTPLVFLEDEEQAIAMERARSTRETRSREHERTRALHAEGLVSDEEFETRRREAEDAEHAAALAELELSRTVIRAPFSGLILRRHLDVGVTVSDGTPVFDLADVEPLYADVSVPERHVGRLEAGQTVRLTTDAASASITAVIERIAPAVDPATGTVKVTLAVQGAAGIRPGAFVKVEIVTDTHAQAMIVPRPALVAEGKRWHLFRLEADGSVSQIEVSLGYEEGDRVEILFPDGEGERLEQGASVVVAGAPALTHGARARVVDESPAGE